MKSTAALRSDGTSDINTLYRDNHGWLSQWLRRKVDNPADADDLAQDTFIRVLCAHARNQLPLTLNEPRAYLVTVAGRLVANFYRRQSIERAYLQVLASLPQSDVPSLETQALMKEALLEIDQVLDGLGRKVKLAFIMAQFEDMPYAEIADKLGVSLRSVKYYVAKGMAQCCLLLP